MHVQDDSWPKLTRTSAKTVVVALAAFTSSAANSDTVLNAAFEIGWSMLVKVPLFKGVGDAMLECFPPLKVVASLIP